MSFYFGFFGAGTVQPLVLLVGGVFFAFGLWMLWGGGRGKSAPPPRDEPGAPISPEEFTSCVRRKDQEWLAREARRYYMEPSHHLYNPTQPTELDLHMMSLFDSIEAGSGDVDAKIDGLRTYLRQLGVFRGFPERSRVRLEWNAMAAMLQQADRGATRSDSIWQLRINWNRLLGAMGSTWGTEYTISPTWIGPAPLAK